MKQKIKYEEPGIRFIDMMQQDVITSSQLIDGGTGGGDELPWEDLFNSNL